MAAPFEDLPFSTHSEHLLQTALTDYLYRRTFPQATVAAPLLLRVDRDGAHGYRVPEWIAERMPQVIARLRASRS